MSLRSSYEKFDISIHILATIMEYNIKGPGVLYYQYVNGPLFGDRTQEVIDTFRKG